MQENVGNTAKFTIPKEVVHSHYCERLPLGFATYLTEGGKDTTCADRNHPSLYTARLSEVLDWLHGLKNPKTLEESPCDVPVLIFDEEMSMERLLFHYDGTPSSAKLIRNFITLFEKNIAESKATIISPSFIPKSKQKEEQEIIELVAQYTAETSFIKFNFTRIGDFWSYAVKHKCTLLVTTKNYQSDLTKVLFHFYKGGMWYNRLSFYLSL